MAGYRKLPDATTLRILREKGWQLKDIAAKYDSTESGVWRALERAGMTENKITYRDILPWVIAPQHKTTATMWRFRSILKQRQGIELNQNEQHLLDRFLDKLDRSGMVVNYHPEAPPNDASSKGGFYFVPREPADDWIIRRPPMEVSEIEGLDSVGGTKELA